MGGEGSGFTPRKVGIIGLIFLYIAAYQISFGPIAWLLISELFPLEVRGQAVALAVQANFASNMLVALLFPVARDALKHVVGDAWAMSTLFAVFVRSPSTPSSSSARACPRPRASRWRRSSGTSRRASG